MNNNSVEHDLNKSFRLSTKRKLSPLQPSLSIRVFCPCNVILEMQNFVLENHRMVSTRQKFCSLQPRTYFRSSVLSLIFWRERSDDRKYVYGRRLAILLKLYVLH